MRGGTGCLLDGDGVVAVGFKTGVVCAGGMGAGGRSAGDMGMGGGGMGAGGVGTWGLTAGCMDGRRLREGGLGNNGVDTAGVGMAGRGGTDADASFGMEGVSDAIALEVDADMGEDSEDGEEGENLGVSEVQSGGGVQSRAGRRRYRG